MNKVLAYETPDSTMLTFTKILKDLKTLPKTDKISVPIVRTYTNLSKEQRMFVNAMNTFKTQAHEINVFDVNLFIGLGFMMKAASRMGVSGLELPLKKIIKRLKEDYTPVMKYSYSLTLKGNAHPSEIQGSVEEKILMLLKEINGMTSFIVADILEQV